MALENAPKESHNSQIRKRSILIRGHSTSVSLEQAFWGQVKLIAVRRKMSLNALVTEVDESRKTNLSSALRLLVLDELLSKSLEQGD